MGANDPWWHICPLGVIDYQRTLALQHRLVQARYERSIETDILVMVEHPQVFTLGRRGTRQHLRVSEAYLEAKGIAVIHAERGGDITYHGPGQLVAYPIIDLRNRRQRVVDYVHCLEEVMIRTAACCGVTAKRSPLNRGVWVETRKLGSIGIAVRHGITFHGLALNVDLSLEPFDWIHPCGLENIAMTSLAQETQTHLDPMTVRRIMTRQFGSVFGVSFKTGALPLSLPAMHWIQEGDSTTTRSPGTPPLR